jgi:CRISPR system Cascade subunit CasC
MQKKTITMITGPGVYVIEAPMGMGKTEAAQWAAYHLPAKGLAKGIYFALPTQATSNRIHIRMNEFVKRISPECNGSRLTHKVDNEIDFFAAVDDLNKNETGAGMTSTLEFNSATYYRFAALNLDMLANEEHLGDYTAADGTFICNVETRKKVVRAFLKSTILAIPSARKTTMNGNTLPAYVLGIIREKGHPIQLVNAFEIPVYSKQGYLIESINRLIDEYSDLCKTWCIGGEVFKKAVIKESLKSELKDKTDGIVTCSFDNLIEGMVTHVK